jgi:hypothetical protein
MASEGGNLGLSDQYHRLLKEREALPITAHKAMILRAYRSTQVGNDHSPPPPHPPSQLALLAEGFD